MPADVVCGMKVKEKGSIHEEFGGSLFYFCSEDCRNEFRKNPLKFAK